MHPRKLPIARLRAPLYRDAGLHCQQPGWPGAADLDGECFRHTYREVFGLPVAFEDNNSSVFMFGNTLVNLLKTTAAGELVKPAQVASREAGSRFVFTIEVDDVDVMCAELAARG